MSTINGSLKIEDGIPIPEPYAGGVPGEVTAALKALTVGQSVFIPDRKSGQLSGYVSNACRSNTKRFMSRTLEGGCRIWRTA